MGNRKFSLHLFLSFPPPPPSLPPFFFLSVTHTFTHTHTHSHTHTHTQRMACAYGTLSCGVRLCCLRSAEFKQAGNRAIYTNVGFGPQWMFVYAPCFPLQRSPVPDASCEPRSCFWVNPTQAICAVSESSCRTWPVKVTLNIPYLPVDSKLWTQTVLETNTRSSNTCTLQRPAGVCQYNLSFDTRDVSGLVGVKKDQYGN